MSEGSNFNFGTDFSGLAETPPPPPEKPPKTPEFFDDDDDDEVEEEPKTIRDYFEKQDKEKAEKEESETKEEPDEAEKAEGAEEEQEADEESDAEQEDGAETDDESPEMTSEEEQIAAVEIIEERQDAVQNETAQSEMPEDQHETLAADTFLDNAKNEIENGQTVDEALEAAKAKTLEDLGIEAVGAEEEPEPELPETEEVSPGPVHISAAELPGSVEPAEAEEEPDSTLPPTPIASTPPTPPTPPVPPGGGAPGGPGFGGPGFGGPGGPAPAGGNILPPTPSTAPEAPGSTIEDRRGKGRYLLAGGLVGYLVGRRRGRIKTEAKLLPIQHKLEKEVEDLRNKVFWHEASVRSLAHAHAAKHPEAAREVLEQRKADRQKAEANPEKVVEHKTDAVHSERLGRFAVEAKPDRSSGTQELKPVDLMTVPELLSIAEGIEIEQSNIRRLYETNRLNYEGLKRIVRAYLQGERYDQLVRDNLLTPEKYAYPETLTPNGLPVAQDWSQNAGCRWFLYTLCHQRSPEGLECCA